MAHHQTINKNPQLLPSLPHKLFQFIWLFVKRQRVAFTLVLLFSLAWTADMTVWPYALKLLVDKLIAFSGARADIWQSLFGVLSLMAGLWILIEIAFRCQGFIIAKIFPKMEAQVRMALFNYVQHHSYLFFANHFAGNVSNKISDITRSMTNMLQLVMTLFFPGFFAMIIAIVLFYNVNSVFAFLLAVWLCLHIGICLLFVKKCSVLANAHAETRSELTGRIVDVFTNIINVKLFARQRFEYKYINAYQTDELQKNQNS